jgi:hypothetical protein
VCGQKAKEKLAKPFKPLSIVSSRVWCEMAEPTQKIPFYKRLPRHGRKMFLNIIFYV